LSTSRAPCYCSSTAGSSRQTIGSRAVALERNNFPTSVKPGGTSALIFCRVSHSTWRAGEAYRKQVQVKTNTKKDSQLTAATHDGSNHADDAYAGAMLQKEFADVRFIRTRNSEILKEAAIVFDVGGEYAPERNRFDHHQRGGAGERENGAPFASAGLVWQKYGCSIVSESAARNGVEPQLLARVVDQKLIERIDAHDCGVRTFDHSEILQNLNDDPEQRQHEEDWAFRQMVGVAAVTLRSTIEKESKAIRAEQIVRRCYQGGPILELSEALPWHEVVISEFSDVRLVIVPKSGQYTVNTVPTALGAFTHRLLLPMSWAGLRDGEIAEATNVKDAVFCHNGRFIAATRSLEGARALAAVALSVGEQG
jgi:uncharacterized UPF0160 family protein